MLTLKSLRILTYSSRNFSFIEGIYSLSSSNSSSSIFPFTIFLSILVIGSYNCTIKDANIFTLFF